MSQSTVGKDPVAGIYDVERQLSTCRLSVSKSNFGNYKTANHTPWLAKGSQEGYFPTVVVKGATLGSVGKSGEGRRGFDIFSYANKGIQVHTTRMSVGLDCENHDDVRQMLCGVFDKLVAKRHPISKSKYYQDTFPEKLIDGTHVFTATEAMLNPQSYIDMSFEDEATRWDSPDRTWGSFLFGDEDTQTTWYPKVKVSDESQIFLMTTKKKQFQRTSENDQVVYPRDGIQVKNYNVLRTLLDSDLYKNKQWRANLCLQVTGIELKCGQVGTTVDGNPRWAVAPLFTMKAVGPIVLYEHNQSVEEGGLTPDQLNAAQMSVLFEGMSAPNRKRKIKDHLAHPAKVSKSTPTVVAKEAEDGNSDSDGENE